MRRKTLTEVILLLFLLSHYSNLNADIPIIAYRGVPLEESTIKRYREFREAGFDVNLEYYGSTEANRIKDILDIAYQCNVRLIVNDELIETNTKDFIKKIKGHPALFAYYIMDEPKPKDFHYLRWKYAQIRKYDKTTKCYMNLLPNYGKKSLKSFNIDAYEEYVKRATAINLSQISFDFYPITTNEDIRETWYGNLEIIRNQSLISKKPFWGFVLSTPHAVYPQPTISMLRLQVYSNLLYGAQGIQYFTYWTYATDGQHRYHDGPIGVDGKRTNTYYLVKKMNQELKQVKSLFDGAVITNVGHLTKIPQGTKHFNSLPKNIPMVIVKGGRGALLSIMKKDGHTYLLIQNKSYLNPISVRIKAAPEVKEIKKNLSETTIKNDYRISPGDILILKSK